MAAGVVCIPRLRQYSPRRFRRLNACGPTFTNQKNEDAMFITPAFAQGASAAGGGTDMIIQLAPFLLIFVVMYFLILRPQQKKAKAHQEMVNSLRRGDTVVTSGGLVGKVARVVDETEIELQVAEGVKIRQMRGQISLVRSKAEPAKDEPSA